MRTTTAASSRDGNTDTDTDFFAADLDVLRGVSAGRAQQSKDDSGEVALERPERFEAVLPFRLLSLEVGAGRGSQRP